MLRLETLSPHRSSDPARILCYEETKKETKNGKREREIVEENSKRVVSIYLAFDRPTLARYFANHACTKGAHRAAACMLPPLPLWPE